MIGVLHRLSKNAIKGLNSKFISSLYRQNISRTEMKCSLECTTIYHKKNLIVLIVSDFSSEKNVATLASSFANWGDPGRRTRTGR